MNDVEQLVREALRRHEADIPLVEQADVALAGRRARRRQVLNGIGAIAVAVLVTIGVTSGVNSLLRSEPHRPADHPSPPPGGTTVVREGFVGLAPAGTEPSLPSSGELIISFYNFCCPGQSLYVYRDGRIIWSQSNVVEPDEKDWVDLVPQRANKYETGFLEQRLTRRGVELLQSELLSSGLFETNKSFKERIEGASIAVRNGSGLVTLRLSSDHDPIGATAQQAREIDRLIAILKDAGGWLPADAWADRSIRAFIPSRYEVTMHFYSSGGKTPEDPAELPPPADDLLRAADFVKGRTSACQKVSIVEARRIQHDLIDAFGELNIPWGGVFGTPVTIYPVLPHSHGCEGWR